MASILVLLIFHVFLNKRVDGYLEMNTPPHKNAMDLDLYENVLDPVLCSEQIDYLLYNDTLLFGQFLDAGIRTPRGLLSGNFLDMGNYYQCLRINEETPYSIIDGKYCMIEVPLNQPNMNLPSFPEIPEWPDFPWPELNPNSSQINKEKLNELKNLKKLQTGIEFMHGEYERSTSDSPLNGISFVVAVCIPKVCSTQQALDGLLRNITSLGFEYKDTFCRLPSDKPWVPADYVATVLFSLIGLITLLSTAYDIRHTIFLKKGNVASAMITRRLLLHVTRLLGIMALATVPKYRELRDNLNRDPKPANKIYQAFSVHTNTRRLMTYTPVPGSLECLDGVRTFAMMWVILGHTFAIQMNEFMANPADALAWFMSYESLWISPATITVDTFFMMSGLLLVYTTSGKLTKMKLLKNLHLFYLNRLLRMFPVLAAVVLIQASILNRVADGPNWSIVMNQTHMCRVFWWSTLLHIQNYVNPTTMCLTHSWYLAIDVQLHILSPLVLFWMLGGKRLTAWLALVIAMLLALIPASIYNFMMDLPSALIAPSRPQDSADYLAYYYVNTLTRCAPFVVGMIYGYLLHLYRDQKAVMPKLQVVFFWACAVLLSSTVIYAHYPIVQMDWDNQIVDNVLNSFMRPAWALAIGWLVFACENGYGGPINWVLSLRIWKVPSRLTYAMYIVHYPIMFVINSTAIAPSYFTVQFYMYEYMANLFLAVLVAFILAVVIDAPCSTLIKQFIGGGTKVPKKAAVVSEPPKHEPANGTKRVEYTTDVNKTNL